MLDKLQQFLASLPDELFDDPIVIAAPVYFLFIFTEVFIDARKQFPERGPSDKLYQLKDSLASISTALGVVIVGSLSKILAFFVLWAIYQFKIFDFDTSQWWYWVVLFFAEDFSFYWHHRMSHQIRMLWAAHVCHHSSQKLNFSVALRQSWVEVYYKFIFWLWLPLVGFHPLHVFMFMSINAIFQFFPHTQLIRRIPVYEWFFNAPAHHRVHHASNIRYLDRNHAGILIIWDKMFGTFQQELDEEPCIYGITNNISTFNPLRMQSHEYVSLWNDMKSADKLSDKIKYLLKPPGWSHNGPDKTSDNMRREAGIISG